MADDQVVLEEGDLFTVGVEEELILVDPVSLEPVDEAAWVLAAVDGDERFRPEFRAAQIELVTPVCATVADLSREMSAARARLVEALEGQARLLAAGTHPSSTAAIAITGARRYAEISRECPWATRRGLPSGLHVHVGLADPAEMFLVYDAARSYLPDLAALAANSPFYAGRDSGLASCRLKLVEDLPRAGVPPAFGSWQAFADFLTWGVRGRLFPDLTYLWWDLRPRPDLGTLEFRIADAQTTVAEAAALAGVCQALVAALVDRLRAGEPLPVHATHVIAENRWRAVRDGLAGELVDPDSGMREPTRARIARVLASLEPYASTLGCGDEFAFARSQLHENGAERQRAEEAQSGIESLLLWLADRSERPAPVSMLLER